jgi:tetratricopeptide (TPR) repeat protein
MAQLKARNFLLASGLVISLSLLAHRIAFDFYATQGNTFEQQGQWKLSIAAYQTALQLNPSDANTRYNLGFVLEQQGQLYSTRLRTGLF